MGRRKKKITMPVVTWEEPAQEKRRFASDCALPAGETVVKELVRIEEEQHLFCSLFFSLEWGNWGKRDRDMALMERNRESLHRDGWKKPKESAGSVLKTKPYLMMNDKGRSRDTKEHRYSTFERIFFILLFFLFSFFLLEKQLVTPEDHWKLIALYRVTAQKGGDPTCNGLKRCLEDVDSLQQLRRMCMAL